MVGEYLHNAGRSVYDCKLLRYGVFQVVGHTARVMATRGSHQWVPVMYVLSRMIKQGARSRRRRELRDHAERASMRSLRLGCSVRRALSYIVETAMLMECSRRVL